MPVRSPYPDVEIPDVSLTAFLFGDFGDRADAPAFVDGASGRSITFGELATMVDKIAAALAERGVGAGDVVGLFAPNSPEWAAVFHGVLRANAIVTSANSLYTPGELAHQLADSGAKLLVTVSPFLDRARAALAEAGLPDDAVVTLDAVEGVTSLADLLATTATPPELTTTAGDTAVLPYSSGTTGRAKGVILTHRNLVANLCQFAPMGHVGSDTKILAVLPFFHIYGMTVMMNQGLHKRATVVTMPKFDLTEFLRIISEYAVDRIYIAPPVAVALAKHPMVDEYDGEPLHARRPSRHRPQLVGLRAAEHHVQARRPGDRRGGRPRRPRRALGAGAERDERLPEQPRSHRVHPRRRGLPAHRRHRGGHRRGRVLDRRPGQGADQVQGLPGAARRAGGPAAHPRQDRRRRRHRRARRGG
jgi:acyl-CoA synthetase (AMP-forming)/AMP-acid ligase II